MTGTGRAMVSTPAIAHNEPTILPHTPTGLRWREENKRDEALVTHTDQSISRGRENRHRESIYLYKWRFFYICVACLINERAGVRVRAKLRRRGRALGSKSCVAQPPLTTSTAVSARRRQRHSRTLRVMNPWIKWLFTPLVQNFLSSKEDFFHFQQCLFDWKF